MNWSEDEEFNRFDLHNYIDSYDYIDSYKVFKKVRKAIRSNLKIEKDEWLNQYNKIIKINKMTYRHLLNAYRLTGDTRLRDEIISRFSKGLKELGEKNDTLSSSAKASD